MASLLSQASAYDGSETISTNYELGERTNRTNTGTGGRTNAKTIKKRPSYGVEPERKKSIEALMSMTQMNDEDDDSGLADFQPPAKPELTRAPEQTEEQVHPSSNNSDNTNLNNTYKPKQGFTNSNYNDVNGQMSQPSTYTSAHSPPATLQADFNNALSAIKSASNNTLASVNTNAFTNSLSNANANSASAIGNNYGNISEQLNYIIHMLEEQQNSKTSTATEELVLYTFLGVFTIYIVDSFTKIGKTYTR